ncbi:MAG TPA: hypothetical protein VE971_02060, partial [Candidatus Eisenbacteria bacterium]|nr:hypothetical protein [Candidatus Eisenbacteria bacterium]
CNVTSNSITGNSTVNLRKNAGNAGPTLSIGANATGIFNDNTDTYTAAATDAMNYQIVTGIYKGDRIKGAVLPTNIATTVLHCHYCHFCGQSLQKESHACNT